MTTEVKTLVEELNRDFSEFKRANDAALATGTSDRKELADKINKGLTAVEERIAAVETAANRSAKDSTIGELLEFKTSKAGLKHFERLVKKDNSLGEFMAGDTKAKAFDTEVKTQAIVGTNADGGYTVPTIIDTVVNMLVVESSPIEALATVKTITGAGNSYNGNIDNNDATGGWVTETGTRTTTAPNTFTRVSIPVYELYANPQISLQLIEDSNIDAQAELLKSTGAILSRKRATAFVNGTGSNQPSGFVNTTAYSTNNVSSGASPVIGDINYVTGLGTGGTAQQILSDDVFNLVYSLRDQYMAKGQFAANRQVIEAIRKLKDSYGRYMWEPNYAAGQPATLVGYPIWAFADMTNTLTVSGGAYALTFADWENFYYVVNKTGLQILRDPYSVEGFVVFKTRQRCGGGIFQGAAGSTLLVQQS